MAEGGIHNIYPPVAEPHGFGGLMHAPAVVGGSSGHAACSADRACMRRPSKPTAVTSNLRGKDISHATCHIAFVVKQYQGHMHCIDAPGMMPSIAKSLQDTNSVMDILQGHSVMDMNREIHTLSCSGSKA